MAAISAGAPSARMAPSFITVIRSASSITTDMLCSIKSTVVARAIARIRSQNANASDSERPWVGSSMIKSSGASASPMANSNSRW